MSKSKAKSKTSSLRSFKTSEQQIDKEDMVLPPLDVLTVKVKHIRVKDEEPRFLTVKVTFFDQLIVSGCIKTLASQDSAEYPSFFSGTLSYDPSDYEKMCLFADFPLVVVTSPMKSLEPLMVSMKSSTNTSTPNQKGMPKTSIKSGSVSVPKTEENRAGMSCCNIDILPLFIGETKMRVEKRLEPVVIPSVLHRKSYDNLPLLTMELSIERNESNKEAHKLLKEANYMKISLIASYNMLIPFDAECIYTAATKLPVSNENRTTIMVFGQGYGRSAKFNSMSFFPNWESLRLGYEFFTNGDEKFASHIEDFQNEAEIDLQYYFKDFPHVYSTVWGSFHRTLLLGDQSEWLRKRLVKYQWPLELHIFGEKGGYSFMTFLDLTKLLLPGETTVRLAVPLYWTNSEEMHRNCGCDLLLLPYEKESTSTNTRKTQSKTTESVPNSNSKSDFIRAPTGADDESAFVILEVKLAKPLVKVTLPPHIKHMEIKEMQNEFDQAGPSRRECTGRGQQDREWQSTVRSAASALRKVPYHGMTEFCAFNRQLSETRTRVELTTSCWQDAAIYVNNNFIIQDYLKSDDLFEELLIMSHACLMVTTCDTLVGVEEQDLPPSLRAARHARQMQDYSHAMELYLQRVAECPKCPNAWRELSTCLMDVDRDWANVCINKAVVLDPRHPFSLLAKGGILYEEDPEAAEPFFVTLLALYPFWPTAWTITTAYYHDRELFNMADVIIELNKKTAAEGLPYDLGRPRNWGYELGDWWDITPILPGMSKYFDATDLLLRLRAISLAEVCLARAFIEVGESAAYYHFLALCCRLRGNIKDALCHIQTGIQKYGEINYLRSLEGECFHKQGNIKAALESFEKAGSSMSAYSIMLSIPCWEGNKARTVLVDLVRRQPSAYAWMGLADDWLTRAAMGEGGDAGGPTDDQMAAKNCVVACAVQALKWDRMAGRAWVTLYQLVRPSARRLFCLNMAVACGYDIAKSEVHSEICCDEMESDSKQSLCYRLSKTLQGCNCKMCENIKF